MQPGDIRNQIRSSTLVDEVGLIAKLGQETGFTDQFRQTVSADAATLVRQIRDSSDPGLMESFLAEYGLSTDEGIALMCLAEALLRVPDAETIDALIEDKIAPSDWGKHLGQSSSSLVNASTWALMLTGKVLADEDDSMLGALRGLVKRLGEPVIRTAVSQAMREMGRQFVLGRTIEEAMEEARVFEKQGFTYSYDMLGEAARTEADAKRYHLSYSRAIGALAKACTSSDIRDNPGISVKLSALHPRYEFTQRERVLDELVPRTRSLALLAKSAGMGFNIDAEEAERLDLSLDVIEKVLADPSLEHWDGFGVVVQAYGKRAGSVLDWLYDLAMRLDRKIMVRLVKGAYWDTEVKLAQTLGLEDFPVFSRKCFTDVSYIANAKKLLGMADRIYPQFATHNAHSVASILAMARDDQPFEFQRLHGMGEALHRNVLEANGTRCRIYAPVGAHRDLLAYLVRRLLENGANSSFVNQIVDEDVSPEEIAADPFAKAQEIISNDVQGRVTAPRELFSPERRNSKGWNIFDCNDVEEIENARSYFKTYKWRAEPLVAFDWKAGTASRNVTNPANELDIVGTVSEATATDVEQAAAAANDWSGADSTDRAKVLNRAADLYEENFGELFALISREAGKTLGDCINELREAVDFLRYYASQSLEHDDREPQGVFACISPWNFPLAIFTGQISAALAAGNGVIAKPAESTSLIAYWAVQLLHEAGVPRACLQLIPGQGSVVGAALSSNPGISGLCFTGSTATAQHINRSMAENLSPTAPLIAETGGLNAMIVDSTALPEQAVRDIVASAFQSAGQRCSALRVLYVQEDVADGIVEMLQGAMDELVVGDPWHLSTDIGPVIDANAEAKIDAHVAQAQSEGRLLKQIEAPVSGTFAPPALIAVNGIGDLAEEIFGPVLHVARFAAEKIDQVIADINATGYGLTFGLHTRIDDRVQHIVDHVRAGNIYVNRNQIGAIVGSQPFGGEGLSGTGPKAGGPGYLPRFSKLPGAERAATVSQPGKSGSASGFPVVTEMEKLQETIDAAKIAFQPEPLDTIDLPGPTGESNRLAHWPRGVILCAGPGEKNAFAQAVAARDEGCKPVIVNENIISENLDDISGFDAVCFTGSDVEMRLLRIGLACRGGALIPLIDDLRDRTRFHVERHVCIDTTASGGNAALLAAE